MQLEVKVERGPGGRLVLADGGDDGNVVLGIGRVEEGVEPAGPGGDLWEKAKEEGEGGRERGGGMEGEREGRKGEREGRREGGRGEGGEVVRSPGLRILPMIVRTPNTMADTAPTVMARVRKRNSNCCWLSLERM